MSDSPSPSDRPKIAAAEAALQLIEPGMRVGLGTGSTAYWLVKRLGEANRKSPMNLTCVPTSSRTKAQAEEEGLTITTLDDVGRLDLTIDGADEFDPSLNLIKGGGGALLQEKIVATASDRMVVIADGSKEVPALGKFPLPVEVVRFGAKVTQGQIGEAIADAMVDRRDMSWRMAGDAPFITDEGHYILDLHLDRIAAPRPLALILNQIPGVVETGLFIDIADAVILGLSDGTAKVYSPGELL